MKEMFENFSIIEFMSVIIVLITIVLIGMIVYTEITNPCLEYERGSGMSCYSNGNYINCHENKVCVRRKK